jgi:hypothetical protein
MLDYFLVGELSDSIEKCSEHAAQPAPLGPAGVGFIEVQVFTIQAVPILRSIPLIFWVYTAA